VQWKGEYGKKIYERQGPAIRRVNFCSMMEEEKKKKESNIHEGVDAGRKKYRRKDLAKLVLGQADAWQHGKITDTVERAIAEISMTDNETPKHNKSQECL